MEGGKVYVVHNDCIQTAAKKDAKTYKIGITTENTVSERYYSLGLKMPGKVVCDFAYEFDGGKHRDVENSLHDLLSNSNVGGDWFDLNAKTLAGVKNICVVAGGREITEDVKKELKTEETDEDGLGNSDGKVIQLEDPFMEKELNRWNEVSDMKAERIGNGGGKKNTSVVFDEDNWRRIGIYRKKVGANISGMVNAALTRFFNTEGIV